jgi:hypothetical protein
LLRPEHEEFLIRIAYWSAFIGRMSVIKAYIEDLKFSPFIRTYNSESILTAAVRGNNIEMVEYILGFCYQASDSIMYDSLVTQIKATDNFGNTQLHYAYDYDLPEIRSMLKEQGLFFF